MADRKTGGQTRWWLNCLLLVALMLPAGALLAAPADDIAPGCQNLVENGGFEVISPQWQIEPGPRPPMYTNEVTFNNSVQSMRVGNGPELSNIKSISEVRYRPLLFPRDASRIILRFRYQPRNDAPPGEDLQQADLYYYNSNQLAFSLLNAQENDRNWKLVARDLTAYRGQLLSLRFRVWNDGLQGRTWMYVDDVEIEYCSSVPISPTSTPTRTATGSANTATNTPTVTPMTATPSATPSPTYATALPTWTPASPSPTLSPPPSGCSDILRNGGFENFGDWLIGDDPVPPRYAGEQVHSGSRAMLLGNPPNAGADVETYSSISQMVAIPRQATSAQLRWWQLAHTQEQPASTTQPTDDSQELILLRPDRSVIAILARQRSNDGVWQQQSVDLTPYRGQTFLVYFNVYNNADSAHTWMFVDDVELLVCGAGAPPAEAPTLSAQALSATPSPEPTALSLAEPSPVATATNAIETLPITTPQALVEPGASVAPTPTATEPPPAVVILTTPTAAASGATPSLRQPATPPAASATTQPWWRRALNVLTAMCGVLALIAIIIVLIFRISQLRQPPKP